MSTASNKAAVPEGWGIAPLAMIHDLCDACDRAVQKGYAWDGLEEIMQRIDEAYPAPALAQPAAAPLSDEQIMEVWHAMPNGPDGWLKHWGFLQFARAIEARIGVMPSNPTAESIAALEAKCVQLAASLKQSDELCAEMMTLVAALTGDGPKAES